MFPGGPKLDALRRSVLFLIIMALHAWALPVAQAADEVQQIERQYGVVDTQTLEGRRLNAQLTRVVDRVVEAINQQYPDRNFRLRSARILGGNSEKGDRMLNAFALPDGRIYVTLGLMRAVQGSSRSDDELAFVVGHEVTHVVEHHAAQQQKKALPAGIAAILLGALTKSRAAGDLANLGASAYVSHYSRVDEYRADRGGVRAMYLAGYDPGAALTVLQRLEAAGGSQSRLTNGWFGSHPLTENRIERLEKMIDDLRAGREIPDREDEGRNR